MPTLKSIFHVGSSYRCTVNGATSMFSSPPFTKITFVDADGVEKVRHLRGDLAIQTALDEARKSIPKLDTTEFVAEFNSKAASPFWHLS